MITPSLPAYVTPEYLAHLDLRSGRGDGTDGDRCALQEIRHWLDLDAASDVIPDCVCPVIGNLLIGFNDIDAAHRQALKPYLPRVLGTRGDDALTLRRGFVVADFAVRVFAVAALRSAGLDNEANTLAKLPEIVDGPTSVAASRAASRAANASEAASWAASRAASWAASRAASWAASRAANATRAASRAANASEAASWAANASEAASWAANASEAASEAASWAASEAASWAANAQLSMTLLDRLLDRLLATD